MEMGNASDPNPKAGFDAVINVWRLKNRKTRNGDRVKH